MKTETLAKMTVNYQLIPQWYAIVATDSALEIGRAASLRAWHMKRYGSLKHLPNWAKETK